MRGEGRRIWKIVRTSRQIPATPLMTIQKIMNGYRPTPHQSCNRSNIVRNFYCSLVTTELAQGTKKDTAINRVQGDDKHLLSLFFAHVIFNNYHTCHTRTWITSTLRLLNELLQNLYTDKREVLVKQTLLLLKTLICNVIKEGVSTAGIDGDVT